jgi:hydrogenase expression/formation protein HypE
MSSGEESVEEDGGIDPGPSCPLPILDHEAIVAGHGSGGRLTRDLIDRLLVPRFANEWLAPLHDGAELPVEGKRIAFTTDSYVVDPIFFPGGDIGSLAVHGTVNDLAMCGSVPRWISVGLILEEGMPIADLARIVDSMRQAADESEVAVVTGDTKVVGRGKGDGIFINTTGIGIVRAGITIDPGSATPGDKVIVSGEIATHGMAIMAVRDGLDFETEICSDTASLHGLVERVLEACPDVRVLRDPTRGGVASALNEIAEQSGVGIVLDETSIPVAETVRGACEILGLDPLYVANEGKMIAIVPSARAEAVVETMRSHPLGERAVVIGEVVNEHSGTVNLKTSVGGERVVDMLSGDQLPRIC